MILHRARKAGKYTNDCSEGRKLALYALGNGSLAHACSIFGRDSLRCVTLLQMVLDVPLSKRPQEARKGIMTGRRLINETFDEFYI